VKVSAPEKNDKSSIYSLIEKIAAWRKKETVEGKRDTHQNEIIRFDGAKVPTKRDRNSVSRA
jgi:hypothetical protein